MPILIGGKKKQLSQGRRVRAECPRCARETDCIEIVQDSTYTAYFVPVGSSKKVVGLQCTECGQSYKVESKSGGGCGPGCCIPVLSFLTVVVSAVLGLI